jgi:hypothetical protein
MYGLRVKELRLLKEKERVQKIDISARGMLLWPKEKADKLTLNIFGKTRYGWCFA